MLHVCEMEFRNIMLISADTGNPASRNFILLTLDNLSVVMITLRRHFIALLMQFLVK